MPNTEATPDWGSCRITGAKRRCQVIVLGEPDDFGVAIALDHCGVR